MGLHLADIFELVGDYPVVERVPRVVGRAFWAILRCRTAAMGGHWSECEDGHLVTKHYNACRNRSCPRCGYYRCAKWLKRQAGRLLGCPHHHLIFTVPHELNEIWTHNYAVLGKLLFHSVRAAVFTLAADPQYLGAMPGVVMALHTWGQQLFLHPHVHVVMTAGGATPEGKWLLPRRRCLFPVQPLKILFMETFLAGLMALAKAEKLRLPMGWGVAEVRHLSRTIRHKKWNIEVRERYEDPTAVLNYLGRYINGGPIGESRLVRTDGKSVWFRYKDYRAGERKGAPVNEMKVSCREFVRRVLLHVPPPGFHMVRGYGLYRRGGGACEELRTQIREVLPVAPEIHESLTTRLSEAPAEREYPKQCPICGKRVWLRWRPRPGTHEKVAA